MRYTAINDNKDLCKLQALFSNGQYTGNIYPQNNDYFSSMENLESNFNFNNCSFIKCVLQIA